MGLLFVTLMGGGYMNQFAGVWGSAPSDRAKRDMLLAALRGRQELIGPQIAPRDAERRDLIIHLCNQAGALEDDRNNVVHAPLTQIGFAEPQPSLTVVPNLLMSNYRAGRLQGRDLLADFRYCRDYAKVLGQFALDLEITFRAVALPLPQKPGKPSREAGKKVTPRLPRSRVRPRRKLQSSKRSARK
jgi:hypothetical protein